MKWLWILLIICFPLPVFAETLQDAAQQLISSLEVDVLGQAARETGWFDGNAAELIGRLARGETLLDARELCRWLWQKAAGIFRSSLWRMSRLMIPAMLSGCAQWLQSRESSASKAARWAGLLMAMAFLTADLREHTTLCTQTVEKMSDWMQALFPLMVTLLAAVGGTASASFYQPAVMAAAGSVTALAGRVTMPLAVSVAVLSAAGSISDGFQISRLCRLLRQAACWSIGLGFTVFIGVMTVQGIGAAGVDGISIRTAKFAMDRFIPIVGGMFADTVDTLVGCSLVVNNALGVFGLILLLGALLVPLMRMALTMLMYRAAAALMEPVADGPLLKAIGGFADVFQLLFVIQLSVGAMFMLLVAQLLVAANWTVMLR